MHSKLLLGALLLVTCAQASLANSVRNCEKKSFVYERHHENTIGHHCEYAPNNWDKINSKCQDTKVNRPSPINVGLSGCKVKSPDLRQFQFSNAWFARTKFSVKNNGHSIQADALSSASLTVTGGHLRSTFNCLQFHFHWGSAANIDRGIGSEHRLYDAAGRLVSAPMEVHIVCKRQDMSFEQAVNTPDAIAVLGVLIQPQRDGERDTAARRLIAQMLSDMSHLYAPVPHGYHAEPAAEAKPVELVLRDLLPESLQRFVNYAGALTTPGCNPVVQWHLFAEPIRIDRSQMLKFTTVYFDEAKKRHMVNNYRPVQGLHGREVLCSFDNTGAYADSAHDEYVEEVEETGE